MLKSLICDFPNSPLSYEDFTCWYFLEHNIGEERQEAIRIETGSVNWNGILKLNENWLTNEQQIPVHWAN